MKPPRDILTAAVGFEAVRACDAFEPFVSATNVETGRVTVFPRQRLTPDMVMASARLPHLHEAVAIDGALDRDGGCMGDPALFPVCGPSRSDEIVVVQINSVQRERAPRTPQEIRNRLNEIGFDGGLRKELRAIDGVDRPIDEDELSTDHCRRVRVHVIEKQEALKPLGASAKMNAERAFPLHLRDSGRETAARWIETAPPEIGERSSLDLRAMFLGVGTEYQGWAGGGNAGGAAAEPETRRRRVRPAGVEASS